MSITQLFLAIKLDAGAYGGVVTQDEAGSQISCHFTDNWMSDYLAALSEAKKLVGRLGVVCVCDSVREFKSGLCGHKKLRRTLYHGKRIKVSAPLRRGGRPKKEVIKDSDCPPPEGCFALQTVELFEPQTEE